MSDVFTTRLAPGQALTVRGTTSWFDGSVLGMVANAPAAVRAFTQVRTGKMASDGSRILSGGSSPGY